MPTAESRTPSTAPLAGAIAVDDANALLALARSAGMLVTLDGQIGREKYQSVAGSLRSFQCFAAALRDALAAGQAG
ncbi:hypothetical protein LMG28688_02823 [Paraburkholderia caffeinitolerans]|uniref:Uncharacterized protein n=1 Tax=Paraburkholderia caffeinitolerans TaxID=1723730 RepID=A0A6J5FYD1_9BURK|nr:MULTISPECIES: hypothetical protein [Paraburkholderia]CAB3789092.1 hypothetical protein LMG28688_02823 [Paraburkholderia caffeinitolerans]